MEKDISSPSEVTYAITTDNSPPATPVLHVLPINSQLIMASRPSTPIMDPPATVLDASKILNTSPAEGSPTICPVAQEMVALPATQSDDASSVHDQQCNSLNDSIRDQTSKPQPLTSKIPLPVRRSLEFNSPSTPPTG